MTDVIDTVEIHKAVEDSDRFDTSLGNVSMTYQKLDSGEYQFIGEYKGVQINQTVPAQQSFPFIAAYDVPTNNIVVVHNTREDWSDNYKFICFITE